jgi:hypothetical protein
MSSTTLATGQTVTLTGDTGVYFVVSTSGGLASMTVTPVNGRPETENIGPLPYRRTWGPYKDGATAVIVNQTAPALAYEQLSEVGGGVQSPVSGYVGLSLAAIFGARLASEALGCHVYGNSFGVAATMHFAMAGASGGRLYIVANSSVGGATSQAILTKLTNEGIDPTAKCLLFFEGTNDASTGVSTSQHALNMRAIAQYAIVRGVTPIMLATPPSDVTAWSEKAALNSFADRVLAAEMGIPIFDPWRRYVDVDSTWVAGASTDQTHPVQPVYAGAGLDLWSEIAAGNPPRWYPWDNVGQGVFRANVLNLTDSNADNLPDNWSQIAYTGALSPIEDAPWPGRGKCIVAPLNQSTTANFYRQTSDLGGLGVGESAICTALIGLTNPTNVRVSVWLRCFGAASPANDKYLGALVSDTGGLTQMRADFVVPAGTTKYQLWVRAEAQVAGVYTGTLRVGYSDLYRVAAYK